MKNQIYFYIFLLVFIGASCSKDQMFQSHERFHDQVNAGNMISPKIKIAVVSDIHYMDPSLAPDDPAANSSYQADVMGDRKVFELSDPIFRKVFSDLKYEKPDILLIPGDLAKDGELAAHETLVKFFHKLENSGIKVYVINGNNDIDNPDAKSYKTDPATPVASVTESQFAEIYGDFGYDEAIYRDDNSLSYICQPCNGLWVLAIDANKYSDSGVTGKIKDATMAWIQDKMTEARENGITVLPMMHFGVIEHYAGQNGLEPLVEDHDNVASAFMDAGIRLVFTGHYHANDVVEYSNNGKTLTDIQTGSLVTPPYSYRIMTLDDNFINIDSRRVTSVNSKMPGGMDFLEYSDAALTTRLTSLFVNALRFMFGIPKEDATELAPYLTKAWKAYFAGDEKITPEERDEVNVLADGPYPLMADILNSAWTDLPPRDNKLHIKLK